MPAFPDRLLLPLAFSPPALQAELQRLERLSWTNHVARMNYEGSWTILPLRCRAGAKHPIQMAHPDPATLDYVDTPVLTGSPVFQEVLARFRCPLLSARLMRLAPGSHIKEHSDLDLEAELGKARLHVPITTHPEIDFYLNGNLVTMLPGECWYLRLSDPHRVVNRGIADRVHLVIDAIVDDWLGAQLALAAAPAGSPGGAAMGEATGCTRAAAGPDATI